MDFSGTNAFAFSNLSLKTDKELFELYKKEAEGGKVDAMYYVGQMYQLGEGQPGNNPNYQEAFKWYRKVAEGGGVDAMYFVGQMYQLGDGQPRNKPNYEEAVKWVDKAIDAGSEPSISLKKSIQEHMDMIDA